jgi:hypothetical protein
MIRTWSAVLGVVCGLSCLGCQSTRGPLDYKPTVARFFLESGNGDGTPLQLPQSGVHLTVNSKPVIAEGDIVNVELVQVDLGKCLLFQLSPTASRDFYRMSVTHQGRRLVLIVDGEAIGARRIDGAIMNGVVFVFAEIPDGALPKLVDNLKKTSVAMQRELARKG